VQLEQGAAVKLAKPGTPVRPGDSIVTPRGGSASLESNGKDGIATISASSNISVDAKQCAAKGAWKLRLTRGVASIAVPGAADPKRSYQTETSNATASGSRGARWKVQFTPGNPTTRVTVTAGSVLVRGNRGSAVTVKAGSSTVVVGTAAPSKPSS
jgi:ferric-dicitrate binding protein FerR (iron transport regulator)